MLVRAFNAAKALVKRFTSPVAPATGDGRFYSDAEFRRKFRPTTPLKVENKYANASPDGAWPAARRVRAMVRTARPVCNRAVFNTIHGPRSVLAMYAIREEYERHVRNGNVYK